MSHPLVRHYRKLKKDGEEGLFLGTLAGCPHCHEAKTAFTEAGVSVKEVVLDEQPEAFQELVSHLQEGKDGSFGAPVLMSIKRGTDGVPEVCHFERGGKRKCVTTVDG